MRRAAHLETPRASEADSRGTGDATDFPSLTPEQERRLAEMLDAHFDSVWRAGRRMGLLDAQAEENAQDVFALAARKLECIDLGRERAFLLGVAVRLAANARRRLSARVETTRVEGGQDDFTDSSPLAEELLEQKQERSLLDEILLSMSETLREVFTLYEIEELNLPEIAAALDLPEGTAASRLRRARAEFSRKLRKVGKHMAHFREIP